jgi:hypothetical protein
MRTIKVEDKKVLEMLTKRAKISVEQYELGKQMEELEKTFQTNLARYARIDEKVRPLVEKITDKIGLTEYEERSRIFQDKEDENIWYIEIMDRMDEFKERWAKRNDVKA